jgi:hypothetical protein
VKTLEEELGGAKGEVLHRHEEASVAVEVVAEAQGAGREPDCAPLTPETKRTAMATMGAVVDASRLKRNSPLRDESSARMPRAHSSSTVASRSAVIVALLVVGVIIMIGRWVRVGFVFYWGLQPWDGYL